MLTREKIKSNPKSVLGLLEKWHQLKVHLISLHQSRKYFQKVFTYVHASHNKRLTTSFLLNYILEFISVTDFELVGDKCFTFLKILDIFSLFALFWSRFRSFVCNENYEEPET